MIPIERLYKSKLVHNTSMLYLLNAAQIIFPLFTFPYLTRVLSVDTYAIMVYTKSVMSYLQLWVDFAFGLSATKHIVKAGSDITEISHIVSDTVFARFLLGVSGIFILSIMSFAIPLLRQNLLFVWLSYGSVFLSCFMLDYLFRGLEKMHEITLRFVTMKGISTALVFVFVHSDADLLYIPMLDILGSLVALLLIYKRIGKYNVSLLTPSLHRAWTYLKESFEYFVSNVATTAFGALNTLLIGIFLPEADIAIWAVATQLIGLIQSGYSPITSGIYPEMVRNKRISLILKILLLVMPLILIGCIIAYFAAPFAIRLAASAKYMAAIPIFRLLLPVLFFSFPAILLGWSTLGSIGKIRQTTATTITSALFQCAGLGILILTSHFTLFNLAILRGTTEGVLFMTRAGFVYKYRKEFK